MSRQAIIMAIGYWNGSKRQLYWSEVLPGCGGWSGDATRVRRYDPASKALEDLPRAKSAMKNSALDVIMADPTTLGLPGQES